MYNVMIHNFKIYTPFIVIVIYFCFTHYTKAFVCMNLNKLLKILIEMGMPDHLTCLLMQVKKQQLETGMEKQTGSKLGKE